MNFVSLLVKCLRAANWMLFLLLGCTQMVQAQHVLRGVINKSTVLLRDSSPYELKDSFLIGEKAVLTIEPGVEILNKNNFQFLVKGSLLAQGTLAEPILFKGGEIEIKSGRKEVVLEHCILYGRNNSISNIRINQASNILIRQVQVNGGLTGIQVFNNANPRIVDCVFTNVKTGLLIEDAKPLVESSLFENAESGISLSGGEPVVKGNLFRNCESGLVYQKGQPKIVQNRFEQCVNGIKFTGPVFSDFDDSENDYETCQRNNVFYNLNGITEVNHMSNDVFLALRKIEDTLVINPLKNNAAYVLDHVVEVGLKGVLVINPGTVIKFFPSAYIKVNGCLKANGLDTSFITFSTYQKGKSGGGIYFTGKAVNASLKNLKIIDYEGFGKAAVTISGKAEVSVSNCFISGGYCAVWVKDNAKPFITYNALTYNKIGVYVSSGNPEIRGNSITRNGGFGLVSNSEELLVLRNNYWGHQSGPEHTKVNAKGRGDKVTGSVLLNPWLTTEPIESTTDAGIIDLKVHRLGQAEAKVKIKIKNHGSNVLKSATIKVWINGELEEQLDWLGYLQSGEDDELEVLSFTFADDKEYHIKASVSHPNGMADIGKTNNTYSLKLNDKTGKEYSIGEKNGDYKTIGEALNALENEFLGDHVIFVLQKGIYKESIFLKGETSIGKAKSVHFRSESGKKDDVAIEGNEEANLVVDLDGIKNITFSGLSFVGKEIEGADVVNIGAEAGDILLQDCFLEGKRDTGVVIQCLGENVKLSHCIVEGGNTGIFCYAVSEAPLSNITIENNVFGHQKDLGIGLRYLLFPKVLNNRIVSWSEEFAGLDLRECEGFLVRENKIILKADGTGISVFEGKANDHNKGLINHNEIIVNGADYAFATGLEIAQFDGIVKVLNNSVKIAGENTSSTAIYMENGQQIELQKNIFANFGKGYALFIGGADSASKNIQWNLIKADFNNYYVKGDRIIGAGDDFDNLVLWNQSSGLDNHSLAVDPQFEGSNSLIANQTVLDIIPFSQNRSDTTKSYTRYIGAHQPTSEGLPDFELEEILSPQSGCSSDLPVPIRLKIKNNGSKPGAGFMIRVISNKKQVIKEHVGDVLLEPDGTIVYQLVQNLDLSKQGAYQFKIAIEHFQDTVLENNYKEENIDIGEGLALQVTQDTSVCKGTSLWLEANGAQKYVWDNGEDKSRIKVKIYSDTLFNVEGMADLNCRGMASVKVLLSEAFKYERTVDVCPGDSVFLAGDFRREEGAYIDTFQTAMGCDSVMTTHLKIKEPLNPNPNSARFVFCANSPPVKLSQLTGSDRKYKGKGLEANVFYPSKVGSGIYTLTATKPNNCLGYDTLYMNVKAGIEVEYDAYLFAGDSVLLGEKYRVKEGVYRDVFSTENGCDSVVITNLSLIQKKVNKPHNSNISKTNREIEKPLSGVEEELIEP